MDQTELDKILLQGEGTRIEFKEAQNGVPASLYDTVCSFLNHEGGIILLGAKDDGTILGLSGQNLKNLKQDIVTALNNPDVLSPIFLLPVDQLGQDRIERLKGLSLDSRLKDMQDWDELAIALGGSWQEKKGELKNLRLLINNNLTLVDLKKRGSWEEKREELLQKRTRILLAALLLTTLPISIEELASILGYKKKESLREGYLNPLRSHKLIEYTIAQANSPNQKYRITPRGINFLMGSVI